MDSLRRTLEEALGQGYRIERELGGGGMSRVFLADEVALGRQVVVKVLPPELTASVSAERFRKEIQVAAQLQHPHIVPVHAAGASAGLLYFTMPYVEGKSLRDRLVSGALSPADAVRIWREVLDALSYAHSHGVVHRDIKPDNILLSGRHATVTDFGVARAMQAATGEQRVTSTGTVLGTPAYMAPEQASGERTVDHRADIYAAGLVMYEMLAGAPAFEGTSARSLLMAQVTTDPEPLATRQPLVPASLAALVTRCLAKDPAARPQNAEAVLAELEQIAMTGTISPVAGVLPVRRRPWLVPSLAAAAIVVVAGGAWAAKAGKLGFGPPPPPAHDSLRLRIVTASLQYDPADSTLARRVRDAALAELEKEPWLFVVSPTAMAQVAPFVGVDPKAMELPDTIRKYAKRGRTHALVDFSVARAGTGYVLTAQARGAVSDTSLDVVSEAAGAATEVPGAMTRLGQRLRTQLVGARNALPPTRFVWSSGDSPREAVDQMIEAWSDFARRDLAGAVQRARGALSVDSTLVQAYMLISYALSSSQTDRAGRFDALSHAYKLRDRERSAILRLEIIGNYWSQRGDDQRALAAYDSLTRLLPAGSGGWNNLGVTLSRLRRHEQALRVYRRSIDSTYRYLTVPNSNVMTSLVRLGRLAEAKVEEQRIRRSDSTHVQSFIARYVLASGMRDFDEVRHVGELRLAAATRKGDSLAPINYLRSTALIRGQLRAYDSLDRVRVEILRATATNGDVLRALLDRARFPALLAGDTARTRQGVDSALAAVPWESLPPLERPWLEMLRYDAIRGDVRHGRGVAEEWSRVTPLEWRSTDSAAVMTGRAELALASGQAGEALRLFRLGDQGECVQCAYPRFARAFDGLGQRDSARVYLERYASATIPGNPMLDGAELAHAYLRLGELYEERRDATNALKWYGKFADLWASADEPLQAKVAEVKARIERLRKAIG